MTAGEDAHVPTAGEGRMLCNLAESAETAGGDAYVPLLSISLFQSQRT